MQHISNMTWRVLMIVCLACLLLEATLVTRAWRRHAQWGEEMLIARVRKAAMAQDLAALISRLAPDPREAMPPMRVQESLEELLVSVRRHVGRGDISQANFLTAADRGGAAQSATTLIEPVLRAPGLACIRLHLSARAASVEALLRFLEELPGIQVALAGIDIEERQFALDLIVLGLV